MATAKDLPRELERLAETEALLLAASREIERLKDIIWRTRDWVECGGVADRILAEADRESPDVI